MKASAWTKYGSTDGLQFCEVSDLKLKENYDLIKIHAATAFTADAAQCWHRYWVTEIAGIPKAVQ